MSDWSAGYVADIEYLPGFYREQAPAHLYLACVVNGIEPPDLTRGFDYCELGCGTGVTVSLLAAANPASRFHAVDFHPAHIARANALSQRAGLKNIRFHESSFEEIAGDDHPDLPKFDIVTLHGVYSWISADNRMAIVRFLRRHLKPGGLVAVSYNAQPGWTTMMPLQRLLIEYAALVHDRSDRQLAAGLEFAQKLQNAGAWSLGVDDLLKIVPVDARTGNEAEHLVYLAHEYLNGSWQPLFHVDVARDMAGAKLSYAGSATLFENYPELALTPKQRELLDSVKVPSLRETFKDYCAGRPFRRDIFVRGARRMSAARRDAALRDLRIGMTVPRCDARTTIEIPLGEAEMDKQHYEPIFDALDGGVRSVGDLLDLPSIRGARSLSAVELVGMLVGSHQAIAIPEGFDGGTGVLPGVRRFNSAQVDADGDAVLRRTTGLASSVGGSGIHVSAVEALLFDGLVRGIPAHADALTDHALTRILPPEAAATPPESASRQARDDNRAAIKQSLEWCLQNSLPVWQRLGVI